eukprot:TRINITY_DN10818_c0_g1_i3.p1 TRINITY_DN10818_c0_g1~~TRINITY_DN10818_c0_g1_i3.p1  ORF type:complete len:232 (-),score=29.70 TRINITY_DN10818_c0_g1_i3:201-896(-)
MSASTGAGIVAGERYILCDLQNKPDLNGAVVLACEFDDNAGRWHCILETDGRLVRVKPENLKAVPDPNSAGADKAEEKPKPSSSKRRAPSPGRSWRRRCNPTEDDVDRVESAMQTMREAFDSVKRQKKSSDARVEQLEGRVKQLNSELAQVRRALRWGVVCRLPNASPATPFEIIKLSAASDEFQALAAMARESCVQMASIHATVCPAWKAAASTIARSCFTTRTKHYRVS